MIKRLLAIAPFFIFSTFIQAQLIVSSDLTPEEYVQEVFVGGGVEVSNITFNGQSGNVSNNQCGMFEGNDGMIDICNGILLVSGAVEGAMGPNDDSGYTEDADIPGAGVSDVDLEQITGDPMNDAAVLEFDFVPMGDTLRFEYIFGSDEYPEFVNSFNDAFGFFVSGPGISGPYSTPDDILYPNGSANVAVIEGTNTEVSINSINNGSTDGVSGPCMNCEYYVHNGDGFSEPYMSDDYYVQYDGITTILTAVVPVIPGETYHIKLAIADALDSALDSGVFLAGGSFSATSESQVQPITYSPLGLVEQSELCDTGYFYISRMDCNLDSLWYHFEYAGDAVSGVDYSPLPTDTILIEGQTEMIYPMYAIPDGLDEGTETIEVLVYTSDTGVDSTFEFVDTLFINILDSYLFPLDAPDVMVYCPSDSVNINAVGTYPGVDLFEYTWSQNGVTVGDETPFLVPVPPIQWDSTGYDISAIDGCGMPSFPKTVWVYNYITSAPTVDVNMFGSYCRSVGYPLYAEITDGAEPFTYVWSTGATGSPVYVTPFEETSYSVTITDVCDRTAEGSGIVTMPDPVVISEDLQDYVCLDTWLELSPEVSGGMGPYYYHWTMDPTFGVLDYETNTGNGLVNSLTQIDPTDNQVMMTLSVKDYCQQVRDTLGIFDPIDQTVLFTDTISLLNCLIPNVITPNGDDVNNYFQAEELLAKKGTLFIYDRWGKLLSESSDYTWDASNNEDGTYFYVVVFEDGENKKGSFTILR